MKKLIISCVCLFITIGMHAQTQNGLKDRIKRKLDAKKTEVIKGQMKKAKDQLNKQLMKGKKHPDFRKKLHQKLNDNGGSKIYKGQLKKMKGQSDVLVAKSKDQKNLEDQLRKEVKQKLDTEKEKIISDQTKKAKDRIGKKLPKGLKIRPKKGK